MVAAALLAAISSVHLLYYNAVLLFAVGSAGAAVALRNRNWKNAGLVLAICAAAAASLVPYVQTIVGAREWNAVFRLPSFSVSLFWAKLSDALSSTGAGVEWWWALLLVAAIGAGVVAQFRSSAGAQDRRTDAALYCLITLTLSIPAYFAFLKVLSYPTQPWYYLALISLVAVAIEGALLALPFAGSWKRVARLLAAIVVAAWCFMPAWRAAHLRQTNLDLIATKLEQTAAEGDVIVLAPWHPGVTFARYYRGQARWLTLPPISDNRIHRYDLFKAQMAAVDPIRPVFQAMQNALRAGHRVWFIGRIWILPPGEIPMLLAPAPYDAFGWDSAAYQSSWNEQTGDFLQKHVLTVEKVALPSEQPVGANENVELRVMSGWR
ncbi:hypothetical protein BH20VER1_BH20VER1_16210 [soil metagenome]